PPLETRIARTWPDNVTPWRMPVNEPVPRAADDARCAAWASPPPGVVAEIVSQPERLVAIAAAVEFSPGIAVGIARLEVAPEGVHRPITVGPHVQRPRLTRRGTMTGVRIDRHHAPELALALGAGGGHHVRERLLAELRIA